jgi:hypothetical protein
VPHELGDLLVSHPYGSRVLKGMSRDPGRPGDPGDAVLDRGDPTPGNLDHRAVDCRFARILAGGE